MEPTGHSACALPDITSTSSTNTFSGDSDPLISNSTDSIAHDFGSLLRFNVRGILHNATYLRDLLKKNGISEHWLHDYNLI